MRKPSGLAGLLEETKESAREVSESGGRTSQVGRAKSGPRPPELKGEPHARDFKKAMTVYYPPEVSKGLKDLANQENTTVQALVGEAIDLLMRNRGRHPYGAR